MPYTLTDIRRIIQAQNRFLSLLGFALKLAESAQSYITDSKTTIYSGKT